MLNCSICAAILSAGIQMLDEGSLENKV